MIFYVNNSNSRDKEEKFEFDVPGLVWDVGNAALLKGIKKNDPVVPDGEFFVNLMITDDAGIRRINADTRGLDTVTDVLSFPSFTFEKPGLFDRESLFSVEVLDMETGNTWLGDVIINADRVRSQALEYGHAEKREFAFLLTHAVLHLMGYDHETEEDAAVMEKMQDDVLEYLNIPR